MEFSNENLTAVLIGPHDKSEALFTSSSSSCNVGDVGASLFLPLLTLSLSCDALPRISLMACEVFCFLIVCSSEFELLLLIGGVVLLRKVGEKRLFM